AISDQSIVELELKIRQLQEQLTQKRNTQKHRDRLILAQEKRVAQSAQKVESPERYYIRDCSGDLIDLSQPCSCTNADCLHQAYSLAQSSHTGASSRLYGQSRYAPTLFQANTQPSRQTKPSDWVQPDQQLG
ncbi:MAG: hypothetical protein PSV35_00030, partial [bacterium]|nr:hypothetical protein [bacterium]